MSLAKAGVLYIVTIITTGEGEKEMSKQFSDHVTSTILMILTKFSGNPEGQVLEKVDRNVTSGVILDLGLQG